jgi:hypothetical protein
MKIQKIISLDKETAELASRKPNFSSWVRNQLRSERNKREFASDEESIQANAIERYSKIEAQTKISNRELLFHLENRSEEEIRALITILRNGFE